MQIRSHRNEAIVPDLLLRIIFREKIQMLVFHEYMNFNGKVNVYMHGRVLCSSLEYGTIEVN